jgi:hypothetical protein
MHGFDIVQKAITTKQAIKARIEFMKKVFAILALKCKNIQKYPKSIDKFAGWGYNYHVYLFFAWKTNITF